MSSFATYTTTFPTQITGPVETCFNTRFHKQDCCHIVQALAQEPSAGNCRWPIIQPPAAGHEVTERDPSFVSPTNEHFDYS